MHLFASGHKAQASSDVLNHTQERDFERVALLDRCKKKQKKNSDSNTTLLSSTSGSATTRRNYNAMSHNCHIQLFFAVATKETLTSQKKKEQGVNSLGLDIQWHVAPADTKSRLWNAPAFSSFQKSWHGEAWLEG